MAKRFTDTEKFDRAWFRKLPPRIKCAWDWLICRCDFIGTLVLDIDRLSFEVGEPVTLDEIKQHFKIQVIEGDRIWLPTFISFQYGDKGGRLKSGNSLLPKIIRELKSQGLPVPEIDSVLHPPLPPPGVPPLEGGGEGVKVEVEEEVRKGGLGEKQIPVQKQPHPVEIHDAQFKRSAEIECIADLIAQAFNDKPPPRMKGSHIHAAILLHFGNVECFEAYLNSVLAEPKALESNPSWPTYVEGRIMTQLRPVAV